MSLACRPPCLWIAVERQEEGSRRSQARQATLVYMMMPAVWNQQAHLVWGACPAAAALHLGEA